MFKNKFDLGIMRKKEKASQVASKKKLKNEFRRISIAPLAFLNH
jgi:hypothetical protein